MLETWQSDENGVYTPDNGFARFAPNSISKKYNTTVEDIKSLNNLNSNNLSIGQELIIKIK